MTSHLKITTVLYFLPHFPSYFWTVLDLLGTQTPIRAKIRLSFLFEIYFKVIKHLGKFQGLMTSHLKITAFLCFLPHFPSFLDIFGPIRHPNPHIKAKIRLSFLSGLYFKVIKYLVKFQDLSDITSQNN